MQFPIRPLIFLLLLYRLLGLIPFYIYIKLYLFVFSCAGSSLLLRLLSLSQCTGFSLQWPLLLRSISSRTHVFQYCGSWALEHRFNSCGTRVSLLPGMWDLLGSGIEPVSTASAGRFFITEPPGKLQVIFLCCAFSWNTLPLTQPVQIPINHRITFLMKLFLTLLAPLSRQNACPPIML